QWRAVVGAVPRLGRTSKGVRRGALAPVPKEHGHGGSSIIERFKRMAPPSFKGESQPFLAESWMREVEKIFRTIMCAEEDKVSLATYMLQYIEEKRAAQKRSVPPFQRQDRKKAAVYQSPQRPVAAPSQQVVVPQTPSFRPTDKKVCPHYGRTHSGSKCWKLARKCLKCGSTEHQIRDCLRLQQFAQRGAPAPTTAAVAAPVMGKPGRPRAQA
ncbi:hypothetical protein Taro_036194, partial [Colocasia esculenta]|nr:hypothetical protein [Colocasia esculenta]